MKRSKKTKTLTYLLPFIAVLLVVYLYSKTESETMQLCYQDHALCTSALCVPDPNNPDQAICFCDVETGVSMSTTSCQKLQPSIDENGIRTIYSTFSLREFDSKKAMKCPDGTPWTWCLNKRCTVSPTNPSKAICICDVYRTEEWMTLGGDCDTSSCETGYWSGATLQAATESGIFMSQLGPDQPQLKWCEVSE